MYTPQQNPIETKVKERLDKLWGKEEQ